MIGETININLLDADGNTVKGELTTAPSQSSYGIPVVLIDGQVYGQLDLAINGLVPVAETEEQSTLLKAGDIQHIQGDAYIESDMLLGSPLYTSLLRMYESISMKASDVAEYLGVSRARVTHLAQAGQIDKLHDGTYARQSVEAYKLKRGDKKAGRYPKGEVKMCAETQNRINGDFVPTNLILEQCWQAESRAGDYTGWPEYENMTAEEQSEYEAALHSEEQSAEETANALERKVFDRCMDQGFYILDSKITRIER